MKFYMSKIYILTYSIWVLFVPKIKGKISISPTPVLFNSPKAWVQVRLPLLPSVHTWPRKTDVHLYHHRDILTLSVVVNNVDGHTFRFHILYRFHIYGSIVESPRKVPKPLIYVCKIPFCSCNTSGCGTRGSEMYWTRDGRKNWSRTGRERDKLYGVGMGWLETKSLYWERNVKQNGPSYK